MTNTAVDVSRPVSDASRGALRSEQELLEYLYTAHFGIVDAEERCRKLLSLLNVKQAWVAFCRKRPEGGWTLAQISRGSHLRDAAADVTVASCLPPLLAKAESTLQAEGTALMTADGLAMMAEAEWRLGETAADRPDGVVTAAVIDTQEKAFCTAALLTGFPAGAAERAKTLLPYLLPHLHLASLRERAGKPDAGGNVLTTREREVLHWAGQGKTSWEISRIISRSERTVKFHLKNIYAKLGVTNRSQAIAKAAELSLLP